MSKSFYNPNASLRPRNLDYINHKKQNLLSKTAQAATIGGILAGSTATITAATLATCATLAEKETPKVSKTFLKEFGKLFLDKNILKMLGTATAVGATVGVGIATSIYLAKQGIKALFPKNEKLKVYE